jgi:anti-sigma28 factor (negative regulator of flagellin synthesis)
MRIDPKNTIVTPVAPSTTREAAAPRSERQDAAAIVKLSRPASSVREPATAKIERLRAAVDAGTYEVDRDLLAQRIVEDGPIGGGSW